MVFSKLFVLFLFRFSMMSPCLKSNCSNRTGVVFPVQKAKCSTAINQQLGINMSNIFYSVSVAHNLGITFSLYTLPPTELYSYSNYPYKMCLQWMWDSNFPRAIICIVRHFYPCNSSEIINHNTPTIHHLLPMDMGCLAFDFTYLLLKFVSCLCILIAFQLLFKSWMRSPFLLM